MTNCPMDSVEEYNDINTRNEYALARSVGLSNEEALQVCCRFSRDNGRTPMQWDDSPNGGFTSGKPWLKVNPNYPSVNVACQESQPDSVLNYYKKLISLRKSENYRELFTYGDFVPAYEREDLIFAYRRVLEEKEVLVIANFDAKTRTLENIPQGKQVLLSNGEVCQEAGKLHLQPSQVVVLG